ncbi:FAD-dependent oxidoreductase [Nocardioides endophyticus]|uniref:FAD-dependent oxidoreductase n=1 Tax=Nocardioides endophyticus TaxID=1353775 RepID=A0ABP8YH22_9ACTN
MSGTLVVGGSIGGVRTVQQLRRLGYDRPVTLVEAEPHAPYDRPPLSKEVLHDETWTVPTLLDAEAAADLDVELLLGSAAVTADLEARRVTLAHGRELAYDSLVVATGARARRSPWADQPRVHELRTWDDARVLRNVLDTAGSVLVIGAGFIGAEVAAAAHHRGLRIDLVDVAPVPMSRHLGDEVGALFVDLHRRHGVSAHFGTGVEVLESPEDAVTVRLGDGTVLTADAAVVGLGTELNTDWLLGSGLTVDDGLVCDAFCQAAPGVFAVGDVSRWWHPGLGRLVRTEHWTNAVEQAAVVAHNIARPDEQKEHCPVGYVWSNQYDWKVQIAGRPGDGIHHELVAGRDDDQFAALYVGADARLCGVLTVNWPAASVRGRKALASPTDLETAREVLFPVRSTPAVGARGTEPG